MYVKQLKKAFYVSLIITTLFLVSSLGADGMSNEIGAKVHVILIIAAVPILNYSLYNNAMMNKPNSRKYKSAVAILNCIVFINAYSAYLIFKTMPKEKQVRNNVHYRDEAKTPVKSTNKTSYAKVFSRSDYRKNTHMYTCKNEEYKALQCMISDKLSKIVSSIKYIQT